MSKLREHSIWFEREDETEVEVIYTITDYDPGVSWGPPENCYPPEGGEVEIIRVMKDGKEIPASDDECDKWCSYIAENHDFDDEYDDYMDLT